MPRLLRAYYDLAVCPVTFNIVDFLFLAEMERLSIGADEIELIVVANEGDGFRRDHLPLSHDGKEWRLRHIVLPAAALLPSCRAAVYLTDRTMAARSLEDDVAVFPNGYRVEEPIADYADSAILRGLHLGKKLGSLRASPQALKFVENWMQEHLNGRQAVSITLRQSKIQHSRRNSNLDAWTKFARRLDPDRFVPVFVRDTAVIFDSVEPILKDFLLFDFAALDLELRLALYEASYLNLLLDSGPASLCVNDNLTRCIRVKIGLKAMPDVGPGYFHFRGYEEGMQFSHCTNFQKTVWKDDTYEVISEEFDQMVSLIESNTPIETVPLPQITDTVSRFIAGRNAKDAEILCNAMLEREPNSLEAQFLLGRTKQIAQEFDTAAGILEKVAILSGEPPPILHALGESLASAKRNDEAVDVLRAAHEKAPDEELYACDLAHVLARTGGEDEAIEILKNVLSRNPDSLNALRESATIYQAENRMLPDAFNAYKRIMELDPHQNLYRQLANCSARLSDYGSAAEYLHQALNIDGGISPEERTLFGLYLRYAGNATASADALENAAKDFARAAKESAQWGDPDSEHLVRQARILCLLDRTEEAREIYRSVAVKCAPSEFDYNEDVYYDAMPKRLEALRDRINGRDVFIFCHGPSIKQFSKFNEQFIKTDPCIFGLNRFQVLQNSLLTPANKKFELVLITHFHNFIPFTDHIIDFLNDSTKPILAINRTTMDSLVLTSPTGRAIEDSWDEQLLPIHGPGGHTPPSPISPLRFLHGNTLTALIALTLIGKPSRIFVFGADGGIPQGSSEGTHFNGGSREDWRFDFQDTHRNVLLDAMRADAIEFQDTLEVNLLAIEELYRVPRPPIYNVSPESNYGGMTKIDYEQAWRLIQNE